MGGGPKEPGRSKSRGRRGRVRDLEAEIGLSQTRRRGQEQGHPVGGDESSGATWEAKARPGVAHRLALEEREGTVGGGGGSYVTVTGEGGSRLLSIC